VDLKDMTHMLESKLANVSKAAELSLNNSKLIATEQRVRIKLIYKRNVCKHIQSLWYLLL